MNSDIKNVVRQKYAKIALGTVSGCCGTSSFCCGNSNSISFTMIGDEYQNIDGYLPDADLGLGCGLPTEYAGIKKGDTVIDLGSGAGNDVFIARSIVGDDGRVIGLDMTQEMIDKVNINNKKLGFKNVEFRLGNIENMPTESDIADVVVSNCVLNLVPDKVKAFSEIYRILKPGAHFCISDVVMKGKLTEELKQSAEMYGGCVAGALQQGRYLKIIGKAGFVAVKIKESKQIELPKEFLSQYLSDEGQRDYEKNLTGIFSITVVGTKNNKREFV